VVDEVEQDVVRPVQVLEDEHERPALGERLEESAPRGERLVAAVAARIGFAGDPHEWPQVALDPVCALLVGNEIRDRLVQLRLGGVGGIGLEDACLRLHHLADRPEGDSLAVRQRAALPPVDDQVGVGVHRLGELPYEPALADARDADERDQLCPPLAQGAREPVREPVELLAAADELGAAPLEDVDAVAGARSERLPHR